MHVKTQRRACPIWSRLGLQTSKGPAENSGTVPDRLAVPVHVASRFGQANDGRATVLRQILTPSNKESGSD